MGVTIHYIDEGVDRGDTIYQAKVNIEKHRVTLKSSSELSHRRIHEVFQENWKHIYLGLAPRRKQEGVGTYHKSSDNKCFRGIMSRFGWDIHIDRFLEEMVRKGGCK